MQGDIFCFAPAASVREDIDLLVARTLSGARSVFARHRLDLAAKRIDPSVDYGNREPASFDFNALQLGTVKYRFSHGLLLTHSCDIESEDLRTLALIRPLSTVTNESDVATIRGNFNYNYYYLPELPDALPESYADLRAVTTINRAMLGNCERVSSLSDTALRGLYAQLFLCMTHQEMESAILGAIDIEQ